MSENPTPVYDSSSKKYETTRRRIFKDNNGKYKEKLEIKNCEKRTLFGSLPFEVRSNWRLDDLSDIEDDKQNVLHGQKYRKDSTCNVFKQSNTKSSDDSHCDTQTMVCGFQSTLQNIIDKLKDERLNVVQQDDQGVKKIFDKGRDSATHRYSNDDAVFDSHQIGFESRTK